MTEIRTYYTIRNDETGAPLGTGGNLDRKRARDLLLAPRPIPLVKSEWFVTEWYGDGSDDDRLVCQTTADEWLAEPIA